MKTHRSWKEIAPDPGHQKRGFCGFSYINLILMSLFWRYLKKTVLSVGMFCSKCRQKVMKLIATVEDISSIALDPSKNTVTVVGEADPVMIIKRVRKFRKNATIVSIGPSAKEEKKEESKDKKDVMVCTPGPCRRCDVWYVVRDETFSTCSIL